MARIFISYARAKQTEVIDLHNVLQRLRQDVFFDKEITGGEDWWKNVLDEIETCDVFIFALSPESLQSDACRAEYQHALALNKPILPVLLIKADLPEGIREINYVDATDLHSRDTVLELNSALQRLSERTNAGEFAPPDPKPPRPAFPFPDDPLSEIRPKIKHLQQLSEQDLVLIIFKIKQASHTSEKISHESREMLQKIASDPSVPQGIVREALEALRTSSKKGNSGLRKYVPVGIGIFIVVFAVAAFALLNRNAGGSPATENPATPQSPPNGTNIAGLVTDTPTIEPIVSTTASATPSKTATPTATDTPTAPLTRTATKTPTQTPIPLPPGVLLQENFEDRVAEGFLPSEFGVWKLNQDETGNIVYEVDTRERSGVSVLFGSHDWQDYAVEYRVRFLEFSGDDTDVILGFRVQDSAVQYLQVIYLAGNQMYLATNENGWKVIMQSDKQVSFQTDVWYSIRVEAWGNQIRVLLDNQLMISATDSRLKGGALSFSVGSGIHAQFDGVRVTAL